MSAIDIYDIAEFTAVCAALVREGVLFHARKHGDRWVITLTGGF